MVLRNLATWPRAAKSFHDNLGVLSMNSALAITSIWNGIGAFSDQTIAARLFNDAMNPILADVFNVIYVVAGVLMLLGIGWGYRAIEGTSLILLIGALVVRTVAVYTTYGYGPATSGALFQAIVFGVACAIRFYVLLKGWSVVLVKETTATDTWPIP